jgi:hypothetical protein
MCEHFRSRARVAAASLLAASLVSSLGGCSYINEKAAAGMGDYIPHWVGGLPADAPPRPGTPQYDAWMKERERKRLMPAAEREAGKETAKETTKPEQSKLDPAR